MKRKKATAHRARRTSRKGKAKSKYFLRLYVTGATPRSEAAITNLRKLCDGHLAGNYELRVIDIHQQPALAQEGQIIAAPTLVKYFPLPLRRFIGDMSNEEVLLAGLEIRALETNVLKDSQKG